MSDTKLFVDIPIRGESHRQPAGGDQLLRLLLADRNACRCAGAVRDTGRAAWEDGFGAVARGGRPDATGDNEGLHESFHTGHSSSAGTVIVIMRSHAESNGT